MLSAWLRFDVEITYRMRRSAIAFLKHWLPKRPLALAPQQTQKGEGREKSGRRLWDHGDAIDDDQIITLHGDAGIILKERKIVERGGEVCDRARCDFIDDGEIRDFTKDGEAAILRVEVC